MTSNQYQHHARSFAFPTCCNLAYPLLGIIEEISELIEKTPIVFHHHKIKYRIILWLIKLLGHYLGKLAKKIRKDTESDPPFDLNRPLYTHCDNLRLDIAKELGDIEWMLKNIEYEFHHTPAFIQRINIEKLTERKNNNTIITHTDH